MDVHDPEDSPERVFERLKAVSCLIADEAFRRERRARCYAAAMARWWGLPAEQFLDMRRGPKKLPVELERKIAVRPAEANGLKTLVQLCIDRLDLAWEEQAGDLLPDREKWDAMPLAMPTPFEHNKRLCAVPPLSVPPPKRVRVGA